MLGNDIVDLRDSDSDAATLSARFDERVFTTRERSAISSHSDPAVHRWRHWAAKEAAYKALRRQRPEVIFSPTRFEVDLPTDGSREGRARYRSAPDSTSVHRQKDASFELHFLADDSRVLHVIALSEENSGSRVVHDFCRLSEVDDSGDSEAPSRGVRSLACRQLAADLRLETREVEVKKHGRVPALAVRGNNVPAFLSLSHHGDWVGFACAWPGSAPDLGDLA